MSRSGGWVTSLSGWAVENRGDCGYWSREGILQYPTGYEHPVLVEYFIFRERRIHEAKGEGGGSEDDSHVIPFRKSYYLKNASRDSQTPGSSARLPSSNAP